VSRLTINRRLTAWVLKAMRFSVGWLDVAFLSLAYHRCQDLMLAPTFDTGGEILLNR